MERETARKHLWIRSGLFADRLLFGVKQRLTALCACLVSGD
jgi:hypothetical protein